MQAQTYMAYIAEQPGGHLVQFFDVPEAITQGDTLDEAIANASEALDVALETYLMRGLDFPARSAVDPAAAAAGVTVVDVAVDPAVAARGILAAAMRQQGLSGRGLAQRMNRDEKVVRRILGGQDARLELTLSALHALGIRPALAI